MKRILSICIPTFNRCNILKESLNDKIGIFEKYDIEVCISNNCSNDETSFYLEELKRNYSNIKIINQTKNNGLEQNMIDAVFMAEAKYIFPIGDDEYINTIYLEKLLQYLCEKEPDLLVLNGIHEDENRQHLELNLQNLQLKNPQEAFSLLWNKTPPGSFIMKSDILQNNNYKKYLGTRHALFGWLWDYLENKNNIDSINILTTSLQIVNFKDTEKSWKNDYFKIVYYEVPLWLKELGEKYYVVYSKDILSNYLENLVTFRLLLNYRRSNVLSFNFIKDNFIFFKKSQKLKAYITLFIPLGIINILFIVKNYFK